MADLAQLALSAQIHHAPSGPDRVRGPRARPSLEQTLLPSPSSANLPGPAASTMASKKDIGYMNKYVYDAFLWTFSVLVELFFREVHPRGSWKVPKEGPVLFVCAPHANQVSCTAWLWSRAGTDRASSSTP
jgi:hypothetical protein